MGERVHHWSNSWSDSVFHHLHRLEKHRMTNSICPLRGPEAREWVATEIMEWEKCEGWKGEGVLWHDKTGEFMEFAASGSECIPEFHPDEDLNHSAIMEKKIEEMGAKEAFIIELAEIVYPLPNKIGEDLHGFWYKLAHASAYERVQAAWKVINE